MTQTTCWENVAMLLLYALVTGVAAGYCLLAVWVATGRGHWFLRAAVLLTALALLVPIRAYEPLILFGMTSVLLVVGWGAVRWLRASEPAMEGATTAAGARWRFRLADLLLMCVVAGGISWLVSEVTARALILSWWRFALAAVMLGVLSSLAIAVVGANRRWISVPLTIVAIVGAVALDHYVLTNYLYADELLTIYRDPIFASDQGLHRLVSIYVLFALWVLTATAGSVAWHYPFRRAWLRRTVRALVATAAMPCALFGASVYWHMLGVPTPPLTRESEENNLPRILALSRQLSSASPDEAQVIFAELLPLLKRPASVSIDWSSLGRDPDQLTLALADIQTMRAVARQMDAECERLRRAGRPDEAGDLAMAVIRCGNSYRRGGLVIHFLVGEAITGIGHRCLAQCRADLSRAKALEAARLLESIAAQNETAEALLERDALWENLAFTWRHTLARAIQFKIWGNTPSTGMERMLPEVIDRLGCQSDLLTIDLALRAYRADHGVLPAQLDDLVPQYLERIPVDRYSGSPPVYRNRLSQKDFVLYSVGKDGKDNGGSFTDNATYFSTEGYDYDLDTMTRP